MKNLTKEEEIRLTIRNQGGGNVAKLYDSKGWLGTFRSREVAERVKELLAVQSESSHATNT